MPAKRTTGHQIQDEGTAVTQRGAMSFEGTGVSVADSGGKTVVTIDGGGATPEFSGARVVTDNATSVPNNTPTAIAFDGGAEYDTDSYFDGGANTIVTIPADGYYHVGATVRFNGPVATSTLLAAYLDIDAGSSLYGRWEQTVAGTSYPVSRATISDEIQFTSGQTVGVTVTQVQGAAGAMDVSAALHVHKMSSGPAGPTGPTARTYVKLTADFGTTTTTTLGNVTGLSFSVSSGSYYKFEFGIVYRSAANTTGLKVSVTIPSATVFSAVAMTWASAADGTAAAFWGRITASADAVTGTGSEASGTDYLTKIEGILVPSANGTLQAQYASEVSGSTVTIKQGSYGILDTIP